MAGQGKQIIAALDIGSTKIACFIGHIQNSGSIDVIGMGHQVSQGIRGGTITDMKKAEESICAAVAAAEQIAGLNIDKVVVNIAGSKRQSQTLHIDMPITGQEVSQRDINRLIEKACQGIRQEDTDIIHAIPIEYSLDDATGIQDPCGMFGNNLGLELHVITAPSTALFNLANCLGNCHLDIEDYIASPYASALTSVLEDEKNLGVTVIDIGGYSTSIAVLRAGNLVFADNIPAGGAHITNDIAVGLSTNVVSAERIKTLHGNVIPTGFNEKSIIDIPQIGEGGESETAHIERSALTSIIQPRTEEILDLAKKRLEKSGFGSMGGKIILTGGGSQLRGIKEMAARSFARQTRLGTPTRLDGMAESTIGPAFSTVTGILQFAQKKREEQQLAAGTGIAQLKQLFTAPVRFVKEYF